MLNQMKPGELLVVVDIWMPAKVGIPETARHEVIALLTRHTGSPHIFLLNNNKSILADFEYVEGEEASNCATSSLMHICR